MERKKLEGNGVWESSRMMLPEHKQRIIDEELEQLRRQKPVLDPQAVEEIERALAQSMEDHSPVTLSLFAPFEDNLARGIVMQLDRQRGIKLRWSEDDWDWIRMDEVISVST